MLDFITERISVWERLQAAKKPILLYGMGNGADKILAAFAKFGITCDGVFASDGFVRGHTFHGFPVLSYQQAVETFDDFIVVLAFAVYRPEMLDRMTALDRMHDFYAPDVPVVGEDPFTLYDLDKYSEEIQTVYDLLADETSKQVYQGIINFKISGNIRYLNQITSPVETVYRDLIDLQKDEVYLDLGAYNGDTVAEFVAHCPDYGEILAVEPDEKNFRKLTARIEANQIRNCTPFHCAVWDHSTLLPFSKKAGRNSALGDGGNTTVKAEPIDRLRNGRAVTFLKMDVEGAEAEALAGGKETLQTLAPKLKIALYHKNEDFFRLPLMVHQINPQYQLHLRHHPYIPAWETNLYALPK